MTSSDRDRRTTDPTPGYIAIGRIGAPRGLGGEFRVEPLTDFPERFEAGRSLYIESERYLIESARPLQGKLFIKLSGVDDKDAAAGLVQKLIEIPESELTPLAEGEYYRYQLIGLPVRATTGLPLGRVQEIITTGSNDVLVAYGMMGEVLLPIIGDVIKKIDLEDGYIEIEMVPGLIEPSKKRRPTKDYGLG